MVAEAKIMKIENRVRMLARNFMIKNYSRGNQEIICMLNSLVKLNVMQVNKNKKTKRKKTGLL